MSATLRIHGEALEGEIAVMNGLRQGCTMAPTLFNLFFNLVVEAWRWECREVAVTVLYRADGRLIGSRSKMEQTSWSELQFADDMAVVTTSRAGMIHAMLKLFEVTSRWDLTVSVPKTKVMVIGRGEEVQLPLQVGDIQLEAVSHFKYLGSILHQNGLSESDVKERIARASRTFGMLRKPIFNNKSLSVPTKRTVYRAVVLSTLLYGSEIWTTKRTLTQKLESFHNRCLRGIFGITRVQQHTERISSAHVRELFSMKEMIEELVMLRRMQWLGHLARMPDARMPKQILFGRLQRSRPFHGVRMRWKDRVKKDMVALTVLSHWYVAAQDRKLWHDRYCAGMERAVERRIVRE